jgi:hypothetical protein
VGEIRDAGNWGCVVCNFKESHHYRYLRMKVYAPVGEKNINSKSNVCKQVWIRCI